MRMQPPTPTPGIPWSPNRQRRFSESVSPAHGGVVKARGYESLGVVGFRAGVRLWVSHRREAWCYHNIKEIRR